jgi:RNA polymerase sigma-70 factor (ECF subfamily)
VPVTYEPDHDIAHGRFHSDALQPVEPVAEPGRSGSWKDFFETYWRLIYSIALKSGLTEAEAQDVVQETIICGAKDIEKFKRDRTLGSFKGWLRNLTRWRIADQLRKREPLAAENISPVECAGSSGMSEIPDPADDVLEKIWEEEWRSNLMSAAAERVKHCVKEEDYQMFDLNVMRQWPASKVAEALGFLHRHGLIHRDIKPSNIIFVNGFPKLADIGLVTDLSEAGSRIGTEGFIPPEGAGSAQADIYSLGKVLYEISTGHDRNDYPALPEPLGDSAEDRDLIQFNKIVLNASRANPGQRYQSAEDLLTDLLTFQFCKHNPRREKARTALKRSSALAA